MKSPCRGLTGSRCKGIIKTHLHNADSVFNALLPNSEHKEKYAPVLYMYVKDKILCAVNPYVQGDISNRHA